MPFRSRTTCPACAVHLAPSARVAGGGGQLGRRGDGWPSVSGHPEDKRHTLPLPAIDEDTKQSEREREATATAMATTATTDRMAAQKKQTAASRLTNNKRAAAGSRLGACDVWRGIPTMGGMGVGDGLADGLIDWYEVCSSQLPETTDRQSLGMADGGGQQAADSQQRTASSGQTGLAGGVWGERMAAEAAEGGSGRQRQRETCAGWAFLVRAQHPAQAGQKENEMSREG